MRHFLKVPCFNLDPHSLAHARYLKAYYFVKAYIFAKHCSDTIHKTTVMAIYTFKMSVSIKKSVKNGIIFNAALLHPLVALYVAQ